MKLIKIMITDLITPLDEMDKEIQTFQSFLERDPSEEISEIENRGNIVINLLARSSKLLADAKYIKDEKLNSEFVKEMKAILELSPSVANKYINTITKVENLYINRLTEQRKDLEKYFEWNRSLYSKAKEEYKYNHFNR